MSHGLALLVRWVANKLKDEGSIASASVVDANELHATKLADVEDDVNELSTHSPASTADQSTEELHRAADDEVS